MGYPDFTRVATQNVTILASVPWAENVQTLTDTLDVTQFTHATITMTELNGSASLQLVWWPTNVRSGLGILKSMAVTIHQENQAAIFRFANPYGYLAALLNVTHIATSGVAVISADNGPAGPCTSPQNYFSEVYDGNVGAFVTVTQWLDDYYSGPCKLTCLSSQPTGAVQINALGVDLTLTPLFVASLPNGTYQTFDIDLPPTACQVQLNNGSASVASMQAFLTMNSAPQ